MEAVDEWISHANLLSDAVQRVDAANFQKQVEALKGQLERASQTCAASWPAIVATFGMHSKVCGAIDFKKVEMFPTEKARAIATLIEELVVRNIRGSRTP